MTTVAIGLGLAAGAALTAALCTLFRVDFVAALRAQWRRGLLRGLGVWPLLGVVAMIALVADQEASAEILKFICPPGREEHVQRIMPRALGMFVGAGAFVVGASVVLREVLRRPGRGVRVHTRDRYPNGRPRMEADE